MRGIGAGSRVFELLGRKPAIPMDTGSLSPLSAEVQLVGESVAIVGTSGSGKSSIQSLLLRYYDPVRGKVIFDGQDIREFRVDTWRNAIGLVPQDPILFTGTIASNIAFGNPPQLGSKLRMLREKPTVNSCGECLKDLTLRVRHLKLIFCTVRLTTSPPAVSRLSLSGGQRQRLAIARALLKKPAILALDEATSSLDANSEHRVNDAVDKILRKRQTTCLFVAHRLSTIARAERIVVLEDGRITESGTYRQLVNNLDSRFRVLMAAQLNATNTQESATLSDSSESALGETETLAETEELQEMVEPAPSAAAKSPAAKS
ncbi:hypothetical protein D9757_014109 [Collybiopsis confluens]|uniref:ABC transporter domain-containing protein n=1 Tax=Collybiopsis confluens TaxID=2823264 RepID=A0A8H5CLW1_9AGAR|nr:hypothetical protein D9757_014109 [Collybiopsis confluens]